MVGIPRSTGCATCVKRRIKCDEEKPSCQNCIRYGAECPGYEKGFKFVAARTHRRRRVIVPKEQQRASPDNSTQSTTPDRQSNDSETNVDSRVTQSQDPALQTIHNVIGNTRDQALSIVVDELWNSPSAKELKVFYSLFNFMPERLGRSRLLDSALQCFSLHQLGKMNNDERLVHAARSSYVEGLQRLQRALNHRKHWGTSETFSAIAVLIMYEMFACPSGYDGWMKHATGMARIAQLRGPETFKDPFDKMLFIAFRGIWIMDALFGGKDTFLHQPEWVKVGEERWDPTVSQEQHELMEEMNAIISLFPLLVRDGVRLREAALHGYVELAEVAELTNRTLELEYRLKTWWEKWIACVGSPQELPSSVSDPVFPVVTKYTNYAIATICCSFYAMMIIIHEVLKACNYPQDFSVENEQLVANICKAVEHNGSGAFGPFRMGFSIRIAMEVASVDVKRWIIKWLERASKTYAVVNPTNFPSVKSRPTLDLFPADFVFEEGKSSQIVQV